LQTEFAVLFLRFGCDLAHTAKAAVDSFNAVVFVRLFGAMATQIIFEGLMYTIAAVPKRKTSVVEPEGKRKVRKDGTP
jgi:hypothetical protein